MKWRFWRRRPNLPTPTVPEDDELQAAEVQRHLEAAVARQPRVDEVVRESENLRARNNFGPTIAQALGAPPR